jgi:hypothetical protein
MITLLSKVAVQNQTTPSSIAVLTNIMEGVDGAATFGYTLEETALSVDDNQKQQFRHDHNFDIRVIEVTSESAILDGIVNNQRLAKISGFSPDGFFIWDEPTLLVRNKQFDGILASAVKATKRTTIGYRGAVPNRKLSVYAGDNLLGLYDVSTGASQEPLNGFKDDNSPSGVDTDPNGEMTITTGSSSSTTSFVVSRNIFFPFPGETLTWSLDVISITGEMRVQLQGLQSDGSTSTGFFATGDYDVGVEGSRISLTGAIPANTAFVRMTIGSGVSPVSAFTVSRPMISKSGKVAFTL